jgi:hypothetical protein
MWLPCSTRHRGIVQTFSDTTRPRGIVAARVRVRAIRDTLVMAWHERIMDRSWIGIKRTLLTLLCWITLFKHPHVKYVWTCDMYGICIYINIYYYILINMWPTFIAEMEEHIPYMEHMGHIDLNTYTLGDMIWCDTIFKNLYSNMVCIEYGNKNRYSWKVWLK